MLRKSNTALLSSQAIQTSVSLTVVTRLSGDTTKRSIFGLGFDFVVLCTQPNRTQIRRLKGLAGLRGLTVHEWIIIRVLGVDMASIWRCMRSLEAAYENKAEPLILLNAVAEISQGSVPGMFRLRASHIAKYRNQSLRLMLTESIAYFSAGSC